MCQRPCCHEECISEHVLALSECVVCGDEIGYDTLVDWPEDADGPVHSGCVDALAEVGS